MVALVGRYGLVADEIERVDADKILPELIDFQTTCERRGRSFMCGLPLREEPLKEARHRCALWAFNSASSAAMASMTVSNAGGSPKIITLMAR